MPFIGISQDEGNVGVTSTKPLKWDTNYYRKYSERFIIAGYQSERRYHIEFDPETSLDSNKAKANYYASANKVTGIEVDFDKISLSVGFKSTPPENVAQKGKTTYSNFGFSFGGNKWILETSYRKFKGFYDQNTSVYDTSYTPEKPFYQNPSMVNESVKAKFFYFSNNKKFSYKSAYSCAYRQLKSSATWVLTGNIYYNSLRTDSSFAPKLVREYYGGNAYLNGMRMQGISGGGGFSVNIILWKALFFNLTGIANMELQGRKNTWIDRPQNKVTYTTMSFDLRASLGINNKNFFMTLSSLNDMNLYNSGVLNIASTFYSGSFTIGYRFRAKTPGWYKKIQATKLYNMI
ncbi:MAG TPA: DUF4421 family protein [Bacteroidia bacterium]